MRCPARQDGAVSVVVPCFNEAAVIIETDRRLNAALAETHRSFEIIYVDDGSSDDTFAILESLAARNAFVKVVKLSRNFGQQYALSAGLDAASGDAVVLIDADLQDPPEAIEAMLAKWVEGYDVVYGRRTSRKKDRVFKRATAAAFYRLFNRVADLDIPEDTGDFRLLDAAVVRVVTSMPEQDRFLRGLIAWVGFRQTEINFHREARYAGETKFPIAKMIRFAMDGTLSFSVKPLRIASMVGCLLVLSSLIGGLFLILNFAMHGQGRLELPLLACLVGMIGGMQLLATGVLGEYIGRLFMQAKQRPLYIVEKRIGFRDEQHSTPGVVPGVA